MIVSFAEAEHGYAVSASSNGVPPDRGGSAGGKLALSVPAYVVASPGAPSSSVLGQQSLAGLSVGVTAAREREMSPVVGHLSTVAESTAPPLKSLADSHPAPHRVSRRARAKKPLGNR